MLHLNMSGLKTLPLKPEYPRVYPFTQMINRVFIDQFDPFRFTLMCEPIADILKLPPTNKSFKEMAEERALEIMKLEGNIYLMLSGGIDSSSALVAMMSAWPAAELQRLHILASYHTRFEFPELWNLVCDKFKGRIFSSFKHPEYYCNRGHVITGEHGDQIFGSDVIRKVCDVFGDEGIHMPWQKTMRATYALYFPQQIIDGFIDRYAQTLSVCPFPIKTSFDWVWWFNFTNKWQHVKFRILGQKTWQTPAISFRKVHHFYDTPAWQRWSLDNHDKKIAATLLSYKKAAKEYIVKQTGFSSYMNKPKVGSFSQVWAMHEFYEAITTDYTYLTREQVLEYVR